MLCDKVEAEVAATLALRTRSESKSESLSDTLLRLRTGDRLIVNQEMMWGRQGEAIALAVNAGSSASTSRRIEIPLNEVITISTDTAKSAGEITDLVDGARAHTLMERSTYQGSVDLFNARASGTRLECHLRTDH